MDGTLEEQTLFVNLKSSIPPVYHLEFPTHTHTNLSANFVSNNSFYVGIKYFRNTNSNNHKIWYIKVNKYVHN